MCDPVRGGFIFMFDVVHDKRLFCKSHDVLFFATNGDRLTGFESERMMPLRRVHSSEHEVFYTGGLMQWIAALKQLDAIVLNTLPQGSFQIGDSFRDKLLFLTQTPDKLCLWFARTDNVPRSTWVREELPHFGVVFWYSTRTIPLTDLQAESGCASRRLVAGVEVPFNATAVTYPIRELHVLFGDIK
jgi:hypothetical protein